MTFFSRKGFLAKQVQKLLCNVFPYLEFHNKYYLWVILHHKVCLRLEDVCHCVYGPSNGGKT